MAVTAKGINARLEVALTMAASPKTITSLTRATTFTPPGNATANSTAHGLTQGAIGVLSVASGMIEADGQAVRVWAPTADTFIAQNFNNSAYTPFGTTATILPVATWGLLDEAIGWEESGGDLKTQDDTRLMDTFDRLVAAGLTPQQLAITVRGQSYNSDVMALIENAALNSTPLVFRLTFNQAGGQSVRWCNGVPSTPTFGIQQGALGTGGFSITPIGRIQNGRLS